MDDKGQEIKFHMNPIQYMFYRALWWLNIVLKSRQHGITTIVALMFLDACLFTPNIRAGIIAHKLTDAKRIFRDKIKFAYGKLPEQVKFAMPLSKDDEQEIIFGHNNSGIYVGTTMHSATFQLLHITEYDWLCVHAPQRAAEIKAALETVHAGGLIIIECTSEGVGTDFHNMCNIAYAKLKQAVKLTRLDYKFHFFPAYKKLENRLYEPVEINDEEAKHFARVEIEMAEKIPEEFKWWYVKKHEVLKEKIYSQHPLTPEEAFFASAEGAFYGSYMIRAWEQNRICDLPWEKTAAVHTLWDLGDMHTAIWFIQFIDNWIHCIDFYYNNQGLDLADYAKVLQVKGYLYGKHFIGPDIVASNAVKNGKVMIDYAAECGINFTPVKPHSFTTRVQATRLILNKTKWDRKLCKLGIEGLTNYRKEKNELASTEDIAVYKETAFKDWCCHPADAFGHGAIAYAEENIGGTVMGRRQTKITNRHNLTDRGSDGVMRV